MPALAIIVMSASTIPFSFNQNATVPATSRNGNPDEKPSKHIVHAAGCENARHMEGLLAGEAADSVGIVDDVRCVVREAFVAIDGTVLESIAQ
jgi:hypothetical protein